MTPDEQAVMAAEADALRDGYLEPVISSRGTLFEKADRSWEAKP